MTIAVGQVGFIGTNVSGHFTTAAVTTSATGSGFVVGISCVQGSGSSTTWTITDTFSNSYTHLSQDKYVSGGATYSFDRFYCANGTGGTSHQVVATPSNSPKAFVALIELLNASLTSIYGAGNSTQFAYDAAPPYSSTLSVTPPVTGAFLLGGLAVAGSATPTITESTGFTIIGQTNDTGEGGVSVCLAYNIVTTTGTFGPSFSSTSGVEAYVSVDSFLGGSSTNPAVGQTASIIQSLSSSQAISFGSLPATGSTVLVLGERYSATSASVSASDNQSGNTYTQRFGIAQNGEFPWLLDCPGITAASGTFTVTALCPANFNVALMELDNVVAYYSNCTNTTGGTVSNSFSAAVTANSATSVANSIAVAMMWMDSFGGSGYSVGWSTPSGWTNAAILNTGTSRIGRIDYQVLSALATPSANWGSSLTGLGSTGNWEAAIFVYSGAGTPVNTFLPSPSTRVIFLGSYPG